MQNLNHYFPSIKLVIKSIKIKRVSPELIKISKQGMIIDVTEMCQGPTIDRKCFLTNGGKKIYYTNWEIFCVVSSVTLYTIGLMTVQIK